jgi:alpha-L-fucosidase
LENFSRNEIESSHRKRTFEPTWESIEKNYPGTPQWLRDAKFGIWVHFWPQSAGESGDWYARNLYKSNKKLMPII